MRPTLLAVLLFACGSNNSNPPDSGNGSGSGSGSGSSGPYSCLGKPIPTTAPNPVTLSGSAVTINTSSFTEEGVAGITVNAIVNDSSIGSATTDTSGAYSMSLPTGGTPIDMHLEASGSDYEPTALYPATNLYQNSNGGIMVMITSAELGLISDFCSAGQVSGNPAVGVVVVDCNGDLVSGATVDIPGGSTYYLGSDNKCEQTGTGSAGIAFVFNVPAGSATLSASVNGMQLRSHTIDAKAGYTTTAVIQP